MISYIAISPDGFIARPDGQVDWLETIPNPDQPDYGYGAFYASVDTTLMSNNTCQTVLGFGGNFSYAEKTSYVSSLTVSRNKPVHLSYSTEDAVSIVKFLKETTGNVIWPVGS